MAARGGRVGRVPFMVEIARVQRDAILETLRRVANAEGEAPWKSIWAAYEADASLKLRVTERVLRYHMDQLVREGVLSRRVVRRGCGSASLIRLAGVAGEVGAVGGEA